MEKSKIEKRAEVADYTMEQLRKIYTGFLPNVHVIEGFWNFRSGLKQQRLTNFVESLKLVFESNWTATIFSQKILLTFSNI